MLEGADSAPLLNGLFKNRLLWLGFAVPLLIHSWNSLNYYHDAFQPIALSGSLSLLQGSVGLPWRINLPILGLAYLMALSVSFSIWFFFLFYTLEKVVFARIGLVIGGGDIWTSGGGSVPVSQQQAGGLLMLALFVVWTARSHLRRLWEPSAKRRASPRRTHGPAHGLWRPRRRRGVHGRLADAHRPLPVRGSSVGSRSTHRLHRPVAHRLRGRDSRLPDADGPAGLHHPGHWPRDPRPWQHDRLGPEYGVDGRDRGQHDERRHAQPQAHPPATRPPPRWLPWALFAAIAVGLLGSIWFTMTLAYTYGGINLHGLVL